MQFTEFIHVTVVDTSSKYKKWKSGVSSTFKISIFNVILFLLLLLLSFFVVCLLVFSFSRQNSLSV